MNPDANEFVPRANNRSLSESDLSAGKSGTHLVTTAAKSKTAKNSKKQQSIVETKDKSKSNTNKNNKNKNAKRPGNNNYYTQSRDGRLHVPPKAVSSVEVDLDFNFKFEFNKDSQQQHRVGSSSSFNRNSKKNKHKMSNKSNKHSHSRIPYMSRAQYCQANNRFVISPFTSVTDVGLYDADALLSWDSIVCALITMKSGDTNQCSICLNACHIPKLTHCGHIFCSVCIIRYLSYEDAGDQDRLTRNSNGSAEKKCPICNMIISKADLRSVKYDINSLVESNPKPGAPYKMRLMTLVKGSIFPEIPSNSDAKEKITPMNNDKEDNPETNENNNEHDSERVKEISSPISFVPNMDNVNARFSRFIRSTMSDIQLLMDDEKRSLIKYHQDCLQSTSMPSFSTDSNADIEYLSAIEMALEDLLEREILFKRSILQHNGEKIDQLWKGKLDVSEQVAELLASSISIEIENEEFPTLSPSLPKEKMGGNEESVDKKKSNSTFFLGEVLSPLSESSSLERDVVEINIDPMKQYYYQDLCGVPIFIHPMCMKALLINATESSTIPHLPAFLEANVLEVERVKNEHKISFLKQIPLHINEIALVEIDMSKLLSTSTKKTFEEEVAKRKKNRIAKKKASQKQNFVQEKQIRDEKKQLQEIRNNIEREKEEQLASLALDESLTLNNSHRPRANSMEIGSYSKMTAGYFPALGEENEEDFPEFLTSAKDKVQAAWKR